MLKERLSAASEPRHNHRLSVYVRFVPVTLGSKCSIDDSLIPLNAAWSVPAAMCSSRGVRDEWR